MTLLCPELEDRPAARLEQPTKLGDGWCVDEVLRIAEDDTGAGDRFEHGVGVGERGREHLLARLGRLAKGAGQGLLDDYVLAGSRGGDRDLVVAVGRRADVYDVDVGRLDQRPVIGEDPRDRVAPGEV